MIAHIYFGVELEEDTEELEKVNGSFDDFVIAAMAPELSLPDTEIWGLMSPSDRDKLLVERQEVINTCPVNIERFGNKDYPEFMIALRGFNLSSSDCATPITPGMLDIPQSKIDEATQWCETNGLNFKNPQFLFCCNID